MDMRLYKAALSGDVANLFLLIKDNPDVFEDVAVTTADTPLHIAAQRGHTDFVREILSIKPSFAWELNQYGFSPMHLASGNGHLEIVKDLLVYDRKLCMLKDRCLAIPIHWAASWGRVEILNELLINFEDCLGEVTARGETVLHLALKNNQEEAFLLLIDWVKRTGKEDLLNCKDKAGNTVLQLADAKENNMAIQLAITGMGGSGKVRDYGYSKVHNLNLKALAFNHEIMEMRKGLEARNKMLTTATFTANLAFYLMFVPWRQSHLQNMARFESILFHALVVFSLIGTISALSVIFLILAGLPRIRNFLLPISVLSTASSYACAITILLPIECLKAPFLVVTFLGLVHYIVMLQKEEVWTGIIA